MRLCGLKILAKPGGRDKSAIAPSAHVFLAATPPARHAAIKLKWSSRSGAVSTWHDKQPLTVERAGFEAACCGAASRSSTLSSRASVRLSTPCRRSEHEPVLVNLVRQLLFRPEHALPVEPAVELPSREPGPQGLPGAVGMVLVLGDGGVQVPRTAPSSSSPGPGRGGRPYRALPRP